MMTLFLRNITWIYIVGVAAIHWPANDTAYTLIIFEGSDWCVNCWRLERTVLQDTIFLKELKRLDITIEKIDFPQKNKHPEKTRQYNNSIAEKYDFDGSFPTLVLAKKGSVSYQRIRYGHQSGSELLEEIKQKMEKLE
jgi:hypothetical protein